MQGIQGCFVCTKDHIENEHHPHDDVTRAIKQLKAKHATSRLSKGDKAYIGEMYGDLNDSDESSEREADWEAVDDEDDEESDFELFSIADVGGVSARWADTTLMKFYS